MRYTLSGLPIFWQRFPEENRLRHYNLVAELEMFRSERDGATVSKDLHMLASLQEYVKMSSAT
jgi:hypothetical protein